MNPGENMRRIRETFKLSRAEVSAMTGVNDQYIGDIERDESSPTLEVLQKLASAYNITISELVGEVSLYNEKLNGLIKKLKYTNKNDVYRLLKTFEKLSKKEIDLLIDLINEMKKSPV